MRKNKFWHMTVILSTDIIKHIAEDMEMGMKCWYHIPAGEVLSAPDSMKIDYVEDELWADTFEKIEEKINECIAFECLDTHEEFRIMDSFAENEVADRKLRAVLITALANKKPFRNFKAIIDNSEYREVWFAYRLKKHMEHVQEQLDFYNSNELNEDENE